MKLLHIVPRVAPEIDGIGDFAATLAGRLRESREVESHFLGCDPRQAPPAKGRILRERSSDELEQAVISMNCDAVLLHYAGYGFDRRGVPGWLVSGLETLASRQRAAISIFFHEIWSECAPWRSAFYFAPAQRRLIRRLQSLARGTVTSTPQMQRRLSEAGKRAELAIVPSNIEAQPRRAPLEGAFRAAIFGLEHTRERSVKAHAGLLRALEGAGQLSTLRLLGKGASRSSADARAAEAIVGAGRVSCAGNVSEEEIAREFAEASFCLSFYPLEYLTKSSTVTAALACGCPVVLPPQRPREEFLPRPPVIFCDATGPSIRSELSAPRLAEASIASKEWHRNHADWPQMIRVLDGLMPLNGARTEAIA